MIASEIVETVTAALPEALLVASLGTATSAVRAVTEDGPHVCIAGAMGSALAIALGLADARPDQRIVAVIGDGELLMGASTLWSIAGIRPANLTVVVLADGLYAITGGQPLPFACHAAAVARTLDLTGAVASTAGELTAALHDLAGPSVIEAVVHERVWPGPSPFVDPHGVRLAVRARLAG